MVQLDDIEIDPKRLAEQMLMLSGDNGGRIGLPSDYETGPVGFAQLLPWLFDGSVLSSLLSTKGLLIALASSFVCIVVYHAIFDVSTVSYKSGAKQKSEAEERQEREQSELQRDFTIAQLREFDGGKDNDKPIYVSLRGEVFDVSGAREFYGKGSGYHCFAGREASRALAKLSFDEDVIANKRLDDLNAMELNSLDTWIDKFKNYKCYPIKGRCSAPPEPRPFKVSELKAFKGDADRPVPEGRIDAPIYLGFNGKVYDVSYGGKEYYGLGGPYAALTGMDSTRALSKMSFDEADFNNSNVSDLTEAQRKTLKDWEVKFQAKYPLVGTLIFD